MSWIEKYSTAILISLLVTLLIGYGIFEIAQLSSVSKSSQNTRQEISNSLARHADYFETLSFQFLEKTDRIHTDVNDAIQTGVEKMALYNRLQNYDVWGITVLRNDEKWIWNGFDLSLPSDSTKITSDSDSTSIANYNNVIVFLSQRNITLNDEQFSILTAEKLYQVSELPFTEDRSFQFSEKLDLHEEDPVYFSFFGTMPPDAEYRVLSTAFNDSVGTVYSLPNQIANNGRNKTEVYTYRLSFHLFIFVVFFAALFSWSSRRDQAAIQIFVLLIIALSWYLFFRSGVFSYWTSIIFSISSGDDLNSIQELTRYAVNSVFFFLLFLGSHQLIHRITKPEWSNQFLRTFVLSIIFGAIQVLLILFFIESTQSVLINSQISLLDLELAPNAYSFFFYLFSALFFTAISGIILTLGYHLYLVEGGKTVIISVISAFSFLCTYFLLDLILDDFSIIDWIFLLSVLLLILYLFTIHLLHYYPGFIQEMSGFRRLLIGVFVASSAIYIVIWNATNERVDQNLLRQVTSFVEEESGESREILFNLLNGIESEFSDLTEENLSDQISNVQIYFQQVVQQKIEPEWEEYSFYIKLINVRDQEIASYSTTVETPAWSSSFFNTDVMLPTYRGEQIRWHNNRPVIWDNLPLNLPDRFVSLSRGWIPVYNNQNPRTIIAWIAADVYLERADYNKPMRAVLSETPSDAWRHSFYLAEFTGTRLTRNAMIGLYNHQPQYHKLPDQELEIAERDSINFITNRTAHGSFREVLVNTSARKVVKASTPFPGMDQRLFTYFRLQIILVFFGLFCFAILSLLGFYEFSPFGQSKRFKSRLIDSLALATILFLIVLIFATQYAVGIQNEKKLERELIQNLNNLSESIRETSLNFENAPAIQLSDLTSPFNVDVILYHETNVSESTTPQVFQQNLIPSVIPFPVYDFIYVRQRNHYITTTKIGNEELLVGYQALLNSAGQTIGVLAIPTFLKSPVYKEQLLETTSYLFVVYLFIFALFIGGSVFLSSQITKPLSLIQAGLKKISKGEMKTKVPVTSQDEIGSLAKAYNNMVQRLEEAQKELLKAERESAWKEMAQQVAHEIKNPLTPMKLNLQHLQRQLENNPDKVLELKPIIEKTANNIIGQIESLNKIASDFSKFAQPVQEAKEPLDITELIESVSNLYDHEFAIDMNLSIPDRSIQILGVKEELRRVFVNLIKNAIEACDKEQVIITISLEKNSENILVKISDNGSGIDVEDQDRIFLPRFSTKSSGTGLGLAISKKIIEAHNGEIWFESNKAEGTTFFIELPLN